MKHKFFARHMAVTLSSLVAALALVAVNATAQPTPTDNAVPPAKPDFNAGEASLSGAARTVKKLSASGVAPEVVKAYVESYPQPFNLTADNIIHLHDSGISADVMTAMLNHDKNWRDQMGANAAAAAAAYQPAPAQQVAPLTMPQNPPPTDPYAGAPVDNSGYYQTYPDSYYYAGYPGGYPYYYPWWGYGGWYWSGRAWSRYPGGYRGGGSFNHGAAIGRSAFGARSSFGGHSTFGGARGGFSAGGGHASGGHGR